VDYEKAETFLLVLTLGALAYLAYQINQIKQAVYLQEQA